MSTSNNSSTSRSVAVLLLIIAGLVFYCYALKNDTGLFYTFTSYRTSLRTSHKNDTLTNETGNVFNSTIKSTTPSQKPKEAFVTFSNNHPKYLALLRVLLDSIHAFSTRPIIVFGIDVDLNIDLKKYHRVIKRRLSQKDCGPVDFYRPLQIYIEMNVLF